MRPNQGNAPIFREIAAMAAADLRQISTWAAAMRGTAKMLRWQGAELRERAAGARAAARALGERAAAARAAAQALREGGDRVVEALRAEPRQNGMLC
jgi:hypothetical protein